MPHRLNLVERHHKRLLEIVSAALPLITGSARDADLIGLRYLRQETVEALASYARLVADMVDNAEGSGDGRAAFVAGTLQARCRTIGGSYETFRGRWLERVALDNWAEYRLSAILMMKRVRDEILLSAKVAAADHGEAAWPA